ncbi:hypothetical protein TRAPUB_10691 [Trametes pubescens]|uniref:Uncharacterized protein n=1 Tax=Trametes pubescens TaxID=154538 RepID=A0A1M2VYV2_TRAPU|nr:hypothetical protein TRAPUB_10691 [Trametes pubescens]
MDASLPSTVPRLRLSRFSPQSHHDTLTPVAGPSHNSDFLHADDDEEDAESTPRMSTSAIPDRQSPRAGTTPGLPVDTPAARLRALLARVPNTPDSATPHARPPVLPANSEPNSDFEPPYSTAATPSIARESLKELFSRALREPGNTPRKGKQRRNSIDASEVESSPRVEEERAKYRWKRRSLSDEEAEKSKLVEPSERSFRSSSAASAFDALRQRLDGSTSVMPSLPPEQMMMDMSMPPPNSSMDTAMPQVIPGDILGTPPYATSTPMRTFQMSAHLHHDMQYTSRASSSLSGADFNERQDEGVRDRMHGRERGWNSPVPKSPAHLARPDPSHRHSWGFPSNGRESPAHRLSRKSSAASLVSTEDGRSSRASSISSRADHDERTKFVDQERAKEREREWNKPKLLRSSSSLSLNKSERIRTHSTPTRPDSAASYLSPNRPTLHRHGSSNSLASSSRPSSPAGSISAHSVEEEVEHVIEHVRERNWNSPHPKWVNPLHHRRSLSPLPKSPAGSPPHTVPSRPAATPRSRTNSTPSFASTSKSASKGPARPHSPLLRSTADNKPSPRTRPKSPVESSSQEKPDPSLAGYKTHFGWSFPQKRAPLPPLELEEDSPRKTPSRPSSRASLSATPSHIPVPSPRKGAQDTPSTSGLSERERKRSHRRSITEFSESVGAIPPRIAITDETSVELPPVPIVNGHDDFSSASEDESICITSTPTTRAIPLLSGATTTPISAPPTNGFATGQSPQSPDAQPQSDASLVSPPPTPPPASEAQSMFSLQTPPRRPQFHTPKAVFETPPPPRGMPDLPGPPSEDEEEEDDHTPIMQSREMQGDLTALKTPRPPGAWLATPAPSRQSTMEHIERAGSAPPAEQKSPSSDSGLATPPSTLSRANSLPPKTPAPPGGWVNTPAPDTSARRKGALKVRFDVESETASDGTFERPSADSSGESKVPANESSGAPWSIAALQNADGSTSSVPPESSIEPPPTPPSMRDRIRQKSPSIRVLDAYGREQVETDPVPIAVPETAPRNDELPTDTRAMVHTTPRREARAGPSATPRSRSAVRMVDAMGREIEEELIVEEESFAETPLSRSEALYRMRETLASMAQDLSDADRSSDKAVFDARSYASLEERCRSAQAARNKLSKSLQMAQSAEVELKSKYAPLKSRLVQSVSLPDPPRLSWRAVVWLVVLQLILLAVMYRYSLAQARKIFLTTYYDPFYPELYRYLVKPNTHQRAIPSCPPWSVFTVFSSLQRAGLKGVAVDAWTSASCSISSYFQSFWTGMSYTQNAVPYSWPPT